MNGSTTAEHQPSSRSVRALLIALLACAILAVGSAGAQPAGADGPALSADDEAWVVQTAATLYQLHTGDDNYRGLDPTSLQDPLRQCLSFAAAQTVLANDTARVACSSQVEDLLVFADPTDALDTAVSVEAAPLVDVLPPAAVQGFVHSLRVCLAGQSISAHGHVGSQPGRDCPDAYTQVVPGWIDAAASTFMSAVPGDQVPNFDPAATEAAFRACLSANVQAGGLVQAQRDCTQQTLQQLLTPPPTIVDLGCPGTVLVGQGFQCNPQITGTVTGTHWQVYNGNTGVTIFDSSATSPSVPGLKLDGSPYTVRLSACNDNPNSCSIADSVVQVTSPAPAISAPGCDSTVDVNVTEGCSPVVRDAGTVTSDTTWAWSATNGSFDSTTAQSPAVTFTVAGSQTVTVTACNPTATDSVCTTVSQTVTVGAGTPSIASISCNPQSGPPPLTVLCSVTLDRNKTSQTIEKWSTSGSLGDAGSGDNYTTIYQQPGNYTITFEACNGKSCSSPETFSISVKVPAAPALGTVLCTPSAPFVGDQVTCSVTPDPTTISTTTTYAWSAPGGNPGSGSSTSFTTSFKDTGSHSISLTACNGAACSTATGSIVVSLAASKVSPPSCSPASPAVGAQVSCSVDYDRLNPPTSFRWSAPGGSPSSGTGSTFMTSFSKPGTQSISVTSCYGSMCTTQSTSVTVTQAGGGSITGTWDANNGVWTFTQSGNTVTASIVFINNLGNASLQGTISNGAIQATYQCTQTCTDHGSVTLNVSSNGCTIQGTYTNGNHDTGPLTMTKRGC